MAQGSRHPTVGAAIWHMHGHGLAMRHHVLGVHASAPGQRQTVSDGRMFGGRCVVATLCGVPGRGLRLDSDSDASRCPTGLVVLYYEWCITYAYTVAINFGVTVSEYALRIHCFVAVGDEPWKSGYKALPESPPNAGGVGGLTDGSPAHLHSAACRICHPCRTLRNTATNPVS